MSKPSVVASGMTGRTRREPLTDANLLLTITVCIFFGMYAMAMAIWGGGFLNPQQFFDLFNNNAALIIVSCGLTVVMIAGGIDISVGGITCLVTMSCVVYLNGDGGSVLGSLAIALCIGLAFGLLQGFLISKHQTWTVWHLRAFFLITHIPQCLFALPRGNASLREKWQIVSELSGIMI